MDTDRRAYRVDVRTRAQLYRQALDSIPFTYLPEHDVQRAAESLAPGKDLYYKAVETPIEDVRARAVWYCSYVAARSYPLGGSFEAAVLRDHYERLTDARWIGMSADGRVVATARSLMADELGRFQIHGEKTGFGRLALPVGSIYGAKLPETFDEIALTREVSAFAVDLEARNWHRDALMGLIKTLLNGLQDMGVRYAYTSIDESFFLLVNFMGLRLEQIGKKNYYMGSVAVPSFFVVDGMIENLNPDHATLYEFITSQAALPPDSRYAFYRRGSPPRLGAEL